MKVVLYLNRNGPKIEICLGSLPERDGWEEIVHKVATLVGDDAVALQTTHTIKNGRNLLKQTSACQTFFDDGDLNSSLGHGGSGGAGASRSIFTCKWQYVR